VKFSHKRQRPTSTFQNRLLVDSQGQGCIYWTTTRVPDLNVAHTGICLMCTLSVELHALHYSSLSGCLSTLPADFWTSVCQSEVTAELQAGISDEDVSFIIPISKLLRSLSFRTKKDVGIFKPGHVYEGKVFSCTEKTGKVL
jgi:hypothetical protein